MTRLFACAIIIGLCPSLASSQTANVFCQFDDAEGVVTCVKGGERAPIFRYDMAYPDLGMLSKLSSSVDEKVATNAYRERCRMLAERFRIGELENKFNNSLEGLRVKAESVRAVSDDNLGLYKQIMLLYDGLFGRYRNGLQAYQDFVKTCRVTPYEVRPNRI